MSSRIEYLSDKEVAAIMGVSRVTVCRLYLYGPREGSFYNVDLRDCEPILCGRIRRWRKDYVLACLAHQPLPTETYRKRIASLSTANVPTDPARLPSVPAERQTGE